MSIKIKIKDFDKPVTIKTVSPIFPRQIDILKDFGFEQSGDDIFVGETNKKESAELAKYNFVISISN